MRIDAVDKDMLLILDIISITQVTGGGGVTLTKSETRCTANDIARQVEKHAFGKDVRRMSDQSPYVGRAHH